MMPGDGMSKEEADKMAFNEDMNQAAEPTSSSAAAPSRLPGQQPAVKSQAHNRTKAGNYARRDAVLCRLM